MGGTRIMSGKKNFLQNHNLFLPQQDNSTTIEERHLLFQQNLISSPTYCYFCGKQLGEQASNKASDIKKAQDELNLGAHLTCLQKNMTYK